MREFSGLARAGTGCLASPGPVVAKSRHKRSRSEAAAVLVRGSGLRWERPVLVIIVMAIFVLFSFLSWLGYLSFCRFLVRQTKNSACLPDAAIAAKAFRAAAPAAVARMAGRHAHSRHLQVGSPREHAGDSRQPGPPHPPQTLPPPWTSRGELFAMRTARKMI